MAKKSVSKTAVKSNAFYDIPLDMVMVSEQIRTVIDLEGEAFQALTASIKEKGVLEPILVVANKNGKYNLIAGERRFLACQQLNLPTIPARVLDAVEAKAEILAIQLMENLQREDIDPIDMANAFVSYFNAKHNEVDLDALVNILVLSRVDQSRVKSEYVPTVETLTKLSGKSSYSIIRILSLLKLPVDIKAAVKQGTLPLSQGYIFAANLDNPGLMETFNKVMAKPMTIAELEQALAACRKQVKNPPVKTKTEKSLEKFYSAIKGIKASLTASDNSFQQSDLETLRDDLKALTDLVEQQLQIASEAR